MINASCMCTVRQLHDLCVGDTLSELNLYKLDQINAKLPEKSDVELILIRGKRGEKMQTRNAFIKLSYTVCFILWERSIRHTFIGGGHKMSLVKVQKCLRLPPFLPPAVGDDAAGFRVSVNDPGCLNVTRMRGNFYLWRGRSSHVCSSSRIPFIPSLGRLHDATFECLGDPSRRVWSTHTFPGGRERRNSAGRRPEFHFCLGPRPHESLHRPVARMGLFVVKERCLNPQGWLLTS